MREKQTNVYELKSHHMEPVFTYRNQEAVAVQCLAQTVVSEGALALWNSYINYQALVF